MSIAQIIKEYSAGIRHLDKYRKALDQGDPLAKEEADIVSGMVSDMRYALMWMRLGRRPGNRRGAERKDIYRQRELMTELEPVEMGESERYRLAVMLLSLSERERTCFLLNLAHGLTQEQISDILKLSRASVRKYIDRAKVKVQRGLTG